MRKKVLGLALVSIGFGILLTLFLPVRFWSLAAGIMLVGLGLFFLRCG